MDVISIGTTLETSWDTTIAISLNRVSIENVKALALRLGEYLAGDNSVDDGAVNEGLINHGHILLCNIVEYYRGSIDTGGNSAVNKASSAVAAIVSSKNVA